MAVRTGEEYRESLRDGRQVWINGERVKDVTRHPAFQPVVDGTSLPDAPLVAIERGNAAGVALMTGTNRHEATLFNMMINFGELDDAGIARRLGPWYGGDAPGEGYLVHRSDAHMVFCAMRALPAPAVDEPRS